ncbi:A-agglutinin anchorage subunit-like [Strongylocentrotus purpuratus]|uniref:Tyr recombinase domain-containing protein n=1 Tax=Strongylocentrotus purpuratus TaxID=7668 RepID=A0A7M7PI30_STRPU|nr:A-agglutinin anchorage subunit-like [Strongylocentrotus purpuratus]
MKPGDFTIETDVDSGLSYMKKKDCLTKNNREGQDEVSNSGRMYDIPNSNSCPLRAFQTYVSRLNAKCIWLWQRPKQAAPKDGSCWYCDSPLGVNTIGNKLKSISRNAGCSQVYTNHSLRATTINTLDSAGVQGRDILSISGHKSETSLRHYSRTSDERKREMSGMLANHLYSGPDQFYTSSSTAATSSTSSSTAPSSTSSAPSSSTTTSIISSTSTFSSSQETVAYGGDPSIPTSVEFSFSQIQQQSIQKVFHFHGCNVNIYNN